MFETVALNAKRSAPMSEHAILAGLLLFPLLTCLAASGEDKLPRINVSTELVQVSVVALDQEGRVATGLTKQDFELFEDGVKQDIVECMNETAPVSTALVLDKSRSMRSNLPLVIQGAYNVLDTHLKTDDEFLVVVFDNMPRLIFPKFILRRLADSPLFMTLSTSQSAMLKRTPRMFIAQRLSSPMEATPPAVTQRTKLRIISKKLMCRCLP
jgi:hypothetical protein